MAHNKKIYLIRHGETDNNLSKVLQGGNVDISLNETGRRQAEAFYEKFKSVPFKKIYTSTLKRSIESVENFILDGIPYESTQELNEISYGMHDGRISSEEENGPYRLLIKEWEKGNLNAKMEGGETPAEVRERQEHFLEKILQREDEDPILICMHGRAMRIFLTTVLYYNLSYMHFFNHNNLGLYILNYSDYMFFIEKFNDTSHLKGLAQKKPVLEKITH